MGFHLPLRMFAEKVLELIAEKSRKGELGPMKGCIGFSLTVWVVEMFTTESLTASARSANDAGPVGGKGGVNAEARKKKTGPE